MIEAWTAADVRAAEEPLLAQGVPLMTLASTALAAASSPELVAAAGDPGASLDGMRVALLVGSGSNGGDALHAGAILAGRGAQVTAFATSATVHDEGREALAEAGGTLVDLSGGPAADGWSSAVADVLAADIVFDGILGIGARGALRGAAADLVSALTGAGELERVLDAARPSTGPGFVIQGSTDGEDARTRPARRRRPRVVAVDVPSGIGVDDGTVPGPVLRADLTVTFGATKPGLLLPPATHLAGDLRFVDIGLSQPIVELGVQPAVRRLRDDDVAELWPVPGPHDHKYSRGVVGVVAGTPSFPGAAVLTTTAAVRAGAGMVRYVGPDAVGSLVVTMRPEVVPAVGRVQAWALGPGVPADGADDAGQRARIQDALADVTAPLRDEGRDDGDGRRRVPAVIDAGALDVVAELLAADDAARLPASALLTPHAGELARLLRALGQRVTREDVEAAPLEHAVRAHERTGATVLLKGSATVVVGPGVVYSQADAPPWLATAGAGDVLTGIVATLLAAYSERLVHEPQGVARLAASAALVHGLAADRLNPGGPVAALDVADTVPGVIAELLEDDE
ncbi:hydroxyethylthiazole kinase-like uncharacterized protein yjeF [Sediminihabitans luteus]|uniref:Bifunctional NAD(P)H-hydrate repair enzyme n=1 Tax=Sediminihabitans luteus TaxID=1138585 RepID=A0A2M9CZ51_9CELL|nr:bifunctional ADP-dependent NAD(P)H-hydrate dehydratase/NAD(P)H-hydrate epimerase [Sediminihabitans luteus]PJJ77221.1 hydroxyethylthiazole kinase-like uncharacterized protein yjeF [Sediminihabitans luteus]GII98669.1 carbohydrate kinase [Sediminihabitans luteus]